MQQIKHIIAVASGKGGVGKSTTAVNLALALRALTPQAQGGGSGGSGGGQSGAGGGGSSDPSGPQNDTPADGGGVGLLDADIYGPSQQLMLGVEAGRRPGQKDGQYLLPIEVHGLKTMSMGYLVTEKTPMVWRGPMAGGALSQMLEQTLWGALDFLVIDLPPGTGDIQLTLSQKAAVAGAIIVTTPQDIALLDARKGIEMFAKVGIPVLGIVENMAQFVCSQCGHVEPIFGAEGGQRIAAEYGVELLGSLPLDPAIREQTDSGRPPVVADPEGPVAAIYLQIAERVAAGLAGGGAGQGRAAPDIVISND